MKRVTVVPKEKVESGFVYAVIGKGKNAKQLLYDPEMKETIDYEFINQIFRIEIKQNQEDKPEKDVRLFARKNEKIRVKYRPAERFYGVGPVKSYEGFEYKKEFIQTKTFFKLFDISEEN